MYETPMPIACKNLDEAMEFAVRWAQPKVWVRPRLPEHRVHVSIPRMMARVEDRVLFDDNPEVTGWTPCRILAVSSYPGHSLTFQILLDNGSLFSYVPPHRLRFDTSNEEIQTRLDLKDLVYFDCPDDVVEVIELDSLPAHCRAYFVNRDLWMDATHLFTIDWPLGNHLLHAVGLENGQLALLPSHKVLFGSKVTDTLPPYKKLHATWTVEK
jgi:hypothetical protein